MAGLPIKYLSLLIAIQENPFGTIEELATKAGISKPTAMKRLRLLQGKVGDKRYFVVNPLLDFHNLGLEPVDVLLATPNLEALKKIEEVVKLHPYTAYRCRCYGALNGIFLQFRLPYRTSSRIRELVRALKKEGIVSNYKFLKTSEKPTIYTSLRIEGWNPETLTWEFDWNKWFRKPSKPKPLKPKEGKPGKALNWLTKRDIMIIYELMKGARRKNTEIIRALAAEGVKFTPQTFSRHLRMIKEDCIEGYRVTFDPEAFDIYSNLIIVGKGEPNTLQGLRAKLQTNPIPFESTIRVAGDQLFWFVRLQPTHLSPFVTNLYGILTEMSVCIADYTSSFMYYIWADAFDEEHRQWRSDREFLVDAILAKIIG